MMLAFWGTIILMSCGGKTDKNPQKLLHRQDETQKEKGYYWKEISVK